MSGPASGSSGCAILGWDSDFFGLRIARFTGPCYTRADAVATRQFCADHAIDCVYILLDAADAASVETAQDGGARFVDLRTTFEAPLLPVPDVIGPHAAGEIRPATEHDVPALRRLAATSHRDTRFYADSRFDVDLVDLLYQTWIEKSWRGYADAVLAFELAGEAAGYVTCHLDDGVTGRIGLIAVRQDLRGRGVGLRLLRAAREWFTNAGCRGWTVVTQGSNVPALRLYQNDGFRTTAVQVWLHLWRDRA
jgi:dTDP-4-amino-4,6-dideoxy-D-galactose acyltransferase